MAIIVVATYASLYDPNAFMTVQGVGVADAYGQHIWTIQILQYVVPAPGFTIETVTNDTYTSGMVLRFEDADLPASGNIAVLLDCLLNYTLFDDAAAVRAGIRINVTIPEADITDFSMIPTASDLEVDSTSVPGYWYVKTHDTGGAAWIDLLDDDDDIWGPTAGESYSAYFTLQVYY